MHATCTGGSRREKQKIRGEKEEEEEEEKGKKGRRRHQDRAVDQKQLVWQVLVITTFCSHTKRVLVD